MNSFKSISGNLSSSSYKPIRSGSGLQQEKKKIGVNPSFQSKTFFNQKGSSKFKMNISDKPRVLSIGQLLARLRVKKQEKQLRGSSNRILKPIIPPKSLVIILKEKPERAIYNRRIIDYKHCGLLQRYIGLGGKILPRKQTQLTAKQQRYVAKTIKSARIMALLPFVSKEKGLFR